ncbi:MAG: hypothetical protein K2I06_01015 [Ruminococcus sp.]|nr:hypothetical protein [Ruminococcus sp.]
MKKFISTLAASLMAVSAFTAVSASALNAEKNNALVITTESLKTAITAENGTVIPAGATSVTVSISGNTGFSGKSVKLDVGSADVIVDEAGMPVVDSGDVLGNSLISSAENNGVVMLVSASAEENTSDGDMFTFYIADSSADVSVIAVDPQIEAESMAMPFATRYSYRLGDVNGDKYIDSIDASYILSAISTYTEDTNDDALPVSKANQNLSHYFPYHTPRKAEVADVNESGSITNLDAQFVMNYYSAMATNKEVDPKTMGYAGEWRYYWE